MENTTLTERQDTDTSAEAADAIEPAMIDINDMLSDGDDGEVSVDEAEAEKPAKAKAKTEAETEDSGEEAEAAEEDEAEAEEEATDDEAAKEESDEEDEEFDENKLSEGAKAILRRNMSGPGRQFTIARLKELHEAKRAQKELKQKLTLAEQESLKLKEAKSQQQPVVQSTIKHKLGYVLSPEYGKVAQQLQDKSVVVDFLNSQLAKALNGEEVKLIGYDAEGNARETAATYKPTGEVIAKLQRDMAREERQIAQLEVSRTTLEQSHAKTYTDYVAKTRGLMAKVLPGWNDIVAKPASKELYNKALEFVKNEGYDVEDPVMEGWCQMYVALNNLVTQVQAAAKASTDKKASAKIQKVVGPTGNQSIQSAGSNKSKAKPGFVKVDLAAMEEED